jgi:hypothetical protein
VFDELRQAGLSTRSSLDNISNCNSTATITAKTQSTPRLAKQTTVKATAKATACNAEAQRKPAGELIAHHTVHEGISRTIGGATDSSEC